MKKDLQTLEERVRDFTKRVFPNASLEGITAKIREEAEELDDSPSDMTEAADVMIALASLMVRQGRTLDDLVYAAHLKMDCNERRDWHPADARGVHRHVKEGSHA